MNEYQNASTLAKSLQESHRDDIKMIEVSPTGTALLGSYVSLNTLEPLVSTFIRNMMAPNNDANPEAVQMSKLMKTAVKGILIMYGDKLLTVMLGKDHEKPSKGVDIVEWYTQQFAKVALAMAAKSVYVLTIESKNDDFSEISALNALTISES